MVPVTLLRPPRASRPLPLLVLLTAAALPLLTPMTVEARYKPLSLEEMVKKADRIVLGEITALADQTFTFRVDRSLYGPALPQGNTLTIIRFQDWPCARRWTAYAVGQKLLICLRKIEDPETNAVSWKAMSGGNEGEMPWDGKCVHVHGPTQIQAPLEKHEADGRPLFSKKIALCELEKLLLAREAAESRS